MSANLVRPWCNDRAHYNNHRPTVGRLDPSSAGCRRRTEEVAIRLSCCRASFFHFTAVDTEPLLYFKAKIITKKNEIFADKLLYVYR